MPDKWEEELGMRGGRQCISLNISATTNNIGLNYRQINMDSMTDVSANCVLSPALFKRKRIVQRKFTDDEPSIRCKLYE